MDKIIYYNEDLKANELQEEKLKELLQSEGIKRVVRRKGDENILVECEDKVISINSKGWKLEFNSLNKVQCTTEDVLSEELVEVIQGEKIKLEKEIAVGNTIEIRVKNKRFIAEVFRIYNNGDTISILFDNGTKHTAIHKSCVSKIIA